MSLSSGTAGMEVFERVVCDADGGFGVGAAVEGRIVHDQHGSWRELSDQVAFKPEVKDIRVDIGVGHSNAEQRPAKRAPITLTGNPPPAFGISIVFADISLAFWRVAIGAEYVVRKSALVKRVLLP